MATTTQLRSWWSPPCTGPWSKVALHGEGMVTVRPAVVDAVHALSIVLAAHHYKTRARDTGAYNCRKITGGKGYSLHAYGTALDINWTTNPYGPVLKTDMTAAMVRAIKAIRTRNGKQVWRWGGDYRGNKDAMHFEIACHPSDIATGINPKSLPINKPKPSPQPSPLKEFPMGDTCIIKGNASPEWYTSDGITKNHILSQAHAAVLRLVFDLKVASVNPLAPIVMEQAIVDSIRSV